MSNWSPAKASKAVCDGGPCCGLSVFPISLSATLIIYFSSPGLGFPYSIFSCHELRTCCSKAGALNISVFGMLLDPACFRAVISGLPSIIHKEKHAINPPLVLVCNSSPLLEPNCKHTSSNLSEDTRLSAGLVGTAPVSQPSATALRVQHLRGALCREAGRCLILMRLAGDGSFPLGCAGRIPFLLTKQRKSVQVSFQWPLNYLSRAQKCLFLGLARLVPLEVIADCVRICA